MAAALVEPCEEFVCVGQLDGVGAIDSEPVALEVKGAVADKTAEGVKDDMPVTVEAREGEAAAVKVKKGELVNMGELVLDDASEGVPAEDGEKDESEVSV